MSTILIERYVYVICPYSETFDIRSLRRRHDSAVKISERLGELSRCYASLIVYDAILSSDIDST